MESMLALRKFETQKLYVTFNVRTMATEGMSYLKVFVNLPNYKACNLYAYTMKCRKHFDHGGMPRKGEEH